MSYFDTGRIIVKVKLEDGSERVVSTGLPVLNWQEDDVDFEYKYIVY